MGGTTLGHDTGVETVGRGIGGETIGGEATGGETIGGGGGGATFGRGIGGGDVPMLGRGAGTGEIEPVAGGATDAARARGIGVAALTGTAISRLRGPATGPELSVEPGVGFTVSCAPMMSSRTLDAWGSAEPPPSFWNSWFRM